MLKKMVGCAFPHRTGRSASVGSSSGVPPSPSQRSGSVTRDSGPAPAWHVSATPSQASTPSRAQLEHRRLEEREFVKGRDTDSTDIWYIIDSEWLADWKRFVSKDGPLPGPIRNDRLVDSSGRPKPQRMAVHHYRGVNRDVWRYFESRYRGGPQIRRSTLDLYAEPLEALPEASPLPARPADVRGRSGQDEINPGELETCGQVFFISREHACPLPDNLAVTHHATRP